MRNGGAVVAATACLAIQAAVLIAAGAPREIGAQDPRPRPDRVPPLRVDGSRLQIAPPEGRRAVQELRILGDARMVLRQDARLAVLPGTSGSGVRVYVGSAHSALVRLGAMVEARHGRDGETLTVTVRDGAGQPLGSVRAVDEGAWYRQAADFGPLGTREYVLRLEHGGEVVAVFPAGAGTTYVVPGLGAAVRTSVMPDGSLCIMFMWDEPQPIRIGGKVLHATRLFHIARGGRALPHDIIGSLEFSGVGFPPIEFKEIQVSVVPPQGGTR